MMTKKRCLWDEVCEILNATDDNVVHLLVEFVKEREQKAREDERLRMTAEYPCPVECKDEWSERYRKRIAELELELNDYKNAAEAEADGLDEHIAEVKKLQEENQRLREALTEIDDAIPRVIGWMGPKGGLTLNKKQYVRIGIALKVLDKEAES